MATDNRHRRGFPLRCVVCNLTGPAWSRWKLERGHFTSVRAVPVHCTACGHRWVSRHLEAHTLPRERPAPNARQLLLQDGGPGASGPDSAPGVR